MSTGIVSENKESYSNSNTSKIDNLDKNEFKNMYGELDFYKKRCEVLEKDVQKLQSLNKKLETALKQVQELNLINGKVFLLL